MLELHLKQPDITYVKWQVTSCELRAVSCFFKKVNLRIARYFLHVAV